MTHIRSADHYYRSNKPNPLRPPTANSPSSNFVRARNRYRRVRGQTQVVKAAASALFLFTPEQLPPVMRQLLARFKEGHQDVKVMVLNDELGRQLWEQVTQAVTDGQLTEAQSRAVFLHIHEPASPATKAEPAEEQTTTEDMAAELAAEWAQFAPSTKRKKVHALRQEDPQLAEQVAERLRAMKSSS